jgi:hypothetical protein
MDYGKEEGATATARSVHAVSNPGSQGHQLAHRQGLRPPFNGDPNIALKWLDRDRPCRVVLLERSPGVQNHQDHPQSTVLGESSGDPTVLLHGPVAAGPLQLLAKVEDERVSAEWAFY